jgi:Tfp pilus assembly protein PilE
MIVVAIIAILAAVAIPAYNRYIANAQLSAVEANYQHAVDVVRQQMVKYKNEARNKKTPISAIAPATVDGWVELIEPECPALGAATCNSAPEAESATAAGAADSFAYAALANAETGTIGLVRTTVGRDITVTVSRPAYSNNAGNVTAVTATISSADL